MARTVLDRGITGACSNCWLLVALVMLIAAQVMTAYKLKTVARRGVGRDPERRGAPPPRGAASHGAGGAARRAETRAPRPPPPRRERKTETAFETAGERDGKIHPLFPPRAAHL